MSRRKKKIRHPGPASSTKTYPHGTHARYALNRCRCADCKAAKSEYEHNRRRWRGEFPRQPPPLVDPRPARSHVKQLMGKGMGYQRIAKLASLPPSAVGSLIWGRHDRAAQKIRRNTSERLLAVRFEAAGSMKVPGGEARAIVDELLARGWSKAAIGRKIHGPQARSLQILKAASGLVEANTVLILRQCLTEEVPKRYHPRAGYYLPKGRPPRPVPQTTPGLPTEPVDGLVGRGQLRCARCDKPLAFHLSFIDSCQR